MRVNGQPGRLLRGPAEPALGEAGRIAVAKGLALLRASNGDATQLAALVRDAREAASGRTTSSSPEQQTELRVWSLLAADVVQGRIQSVRIVRNPDKLGHL